MEVHNNARLPAFIVEGQTHVFGLRTNPELTRLVFSGSDRHAYLVRNAGAVRLDRVARAALNLLQRRAIATALDGFTLQIARQLKENPKVGYLVRVNKSAALEGTEVLDTNLLTPIGFGLEPLDALAESYRIPTIRALPSPLPDVSEYVWYTWSGDQLVPARYDLAFPRQLEREARAEANRRFVAGNVKIETTTGIVRAQAAEYWVDFQRMREDLLSDIALKRKISDMTASLGAAQDQFNFAYENYQTAAREMARNAAEMQTLERIGAVISLLSAGAEVVQAAQQWRANRQADLTSTRDTHRGQAQQARTEVVRQQDALVQEWTNVQGSVGTGVILQTPSIPSVDLKIEIIESRPFGAPDGRGTTQVILYRE